MNENLLYLYMITNKINQKIYIGQTNNLSLRWSQHKYNAKNDIGNQLISRAIKKYGYENFEFNCIATCQTQEDIDFTEEQLIQQYDSCNLEKGYNIAPGGKKLIHTSEIRKKISESLKSYYMIYDSPLKGKQLSNEWKKNISESSMGKVGVNIGKKFSKEHKNKMSDALTGKVRLKTRKFSLEVELEICNNYINEKLSTDKLAKKFNCSKSLVQDILHRNNVSMRHCLSAKNGFHYLFSEQTELEICDIYQNEKLTRSELAEMFNCGKTTIRDILIRHKIIDR